MKIYNSFSDKYNNVYTFSTYMEFATFWFSMARKEAISRFPNFKKLQIAAYNSKEARAKA